jgi:hypothetical protein
LLCASGIAVVVAVTYAAAPPKTTSDEASKQVASLLNERRDALQELVKIREGQFQSRSPGFSFEALLHAKDQLADAEAEMATTRTDRIAAYEKKVENLRWGESLIAQRVKSGIGATPDDLLQARAARLKAEIQLARERAGETRARAEEAKAEPTFEGRSLEEWKRLSTSDLSGETRKKSMQAFYEFGRAGRCDEAFAATKAALDQATNYDHVDYVLVKAGYETLRRLRPEAPPVLLDGLKSEKVKVRGIVAELLGVSYYAKNLTDQIVSALVRATEDEDASVRAIACHSLGRLARNTEGKRFADQIVPALMKALRQKQVVECILDGVIAYSSARREACVALREYGVKAEAAVPALLGIAQEEVEPDKWNLGTDQELAIRALGEIGPAAKSAIAVLERLRDDKALWYSRKSGVSRIHMAAGEALKKIQGSKPADAAPR